MLVKETVQFVADLEIKYEEAQSLFIIGCEFSRDYDDDYEDIVIKYGGKVVATINQKYRWKIEDLIVRKSVKSIKLVEIKKYYITLDLNLTAELIEENIPKVANVQTAGIYMISINDGTSVYVGQSGNINQRLINHWKNLSIGTHHNRLLQRAWDISQNKISVVLLEGLEDLYIGNLEQQKYLEAREQYWIAKYRLETQVLNRTDGEIVSTPLAIKELNEITKVKNDEHDENVKKIRKEINSKIKVLEEEGRQYSVRVYQLESELKELKKYLFWHTGIVSILSSEKPSEIRNKKIRFEIAQHAMNTYQNKKSEIRREIRLLEEERRLQRTTKERNPRRRGFY
jgi:hypothetical protein